MSDPARDTTHVGATIIRFLLDHSDGHAEEIFTRDTATTMVPRIGEHVHLDGDPYYVEMVEHHLRKKDHARGDEITVQLPCLGCDGRGCDVTNHPDYDDHAE